VCAAESLDAVKRQIDQVTIDGLRALVSQQEQKLSELVLQMEQADRSWLPGRFATIRRKQVPELAR
jgi:flagellar biosynthesis chaperone FliJ